MTASAVAPRAHCGARSAVFGQESTRFLLVPGSITRGSDWTAIDQTIPS